jgi:hypothetical protein
MPTIQIGVDFAESVFEARPDDLRPWAAVVSRQSWPASVGVLESNRPVTCSGSPPVSLRASETP